jgi:hypothetical protein
VLVVICFCCAVNVIEEMSEAQSNILFDINYFFKSGANVYLLTHRFNLIITIII